MNYTVEHYITPDDKDQTQEWLDDLRDFRARIAILRRIDRVELGNFGDHKSVGGGVSELRIDVGPGYRVYYAQAGNTLVLLLLGGDKRSQQSDIEHAISCWNDWQRRDK
ncbi:MAG: type II toxin-antitoxin system RelE/ParE family toxin [Pseudomonadota bacterium]|nr:type II toxin-antitoxin system RelE/ParE family toxin [Pseudomonadota bacterium]